MKYNTEFEPNLSGRSNAHEPALERGTMMYLCKES